jgi:hypothetical protein
MRKIAAERRCRERRWCEWREWLDERVREDGNGRWEKNCGERWGSKSGEFFLLTFCLRATGCRDHGTGRDTRIAT